jgi:hypothetical protein
VYPTPAVLLGEPALPLECMVMSAAIAHGRDDPTTQPVASAMTLELVGILPPETGIGSRIILEAELAGVRYPRFAGSISDLAVEWNPDDGQALARIIAVGDIALLGRRLIGAEPWPAELDGARVSRVLTLAGFPPDPLATDPGVVTVLPRDVDRQPALEVAQDAAEDGHGIVWQARDGTIAYADMEHRRGGDVRAELLACELGAGASWAISLEGLANDATVRYGAANPQAEARAVKAASEVYAASISTRIASLEDAQERANAIIARQGEPAWILGGLELELALPWFDVTDTAAILALEVHDLMSVTGLPEGGPASSVLVWLEGWSEHIDPGSWSLALFTSDYCRTAAYTRWDDLASSVTWDSVDPGRTWDGSSCVAPAPPSGRWNDVPASLRWDTVDPALTWDAWAY